MTSWWHCGIIIDVKRYSGTLTIRMHPTLHARLAKAAFARGLSLNRLLIEYLRDAWVKDHGTAPPVETRQDSVQQNRSVVPEDLK